MKSAAPPREGINSIQEDQTEMQAKELPGKNKSPVIVLILTLGFCALGSIPEIRANRNLLATFLGVGGLLLAWQVALWVTKWRAGRLPGIKFVVVKSHYVQACVQFSIYLYWGWYWREIYHHLPLIFAQVIFLYILGALLAWSQDRTWHTGFGPFPIILSTNFFMWFRDDWFYFQFLMIATGALGKEFIRWNRDGKRTHIFNPSALGLSIFSLALILTGKTDITWARELATTIDSVPHIYLYIFLAGFVVQYLFSVTLMTFAAVGSLVALNLIYTGSTGVYYFVNTNVSAAVFLGLHLLMTDPSTSPRTYLGRMIFGGLYGLGVFILFGLLDHFDAPVLYAKLLQVPLLNLSVKIIDRFSRAVPLGVLTRRPDEVSNPRQLNLIYMGCWSALFLTLLGTGFLGGRHPGNSIPFWKKALAEGKPRAAHGLIMATGAQANSNSGAANNELGVMFMEGKVPGLKQNNARAAKYFSRACDLHDGCGCENVAIQFLFLGERKSDQDARRAFELLEQDCNSAHETLSCFLIGFAYEHGRGRPLDKQRAVEFYRQCGLTNLYAVKGLARIALATSVSELDSKNVIQALSNAARSGDAEGAWYLAYMLHEGKGVSRDEQKARMYMGMACKLKMVSACAISESGVWPAYKNPQPMVVPGWSTAFPIH